MKTFAFVYVIKKKSYKAGPKVAEYIPLMNTNLHLFCKHNVTGETYMSYLPYQCHFRVRKKPHSICLRKYRKLL